MTPSALRRSTVAAGAAATVALLLAACLVEIAPLAPRADAGSPSGDVPDGMVAVPGGTFRMGCAAGTAPPCADDEIPAHSVTIDPAFLDRTEVTQAAYAACVAAGACTPATLGPCDTYAPAERGDHPVTCVIYDQALTYCRFLGKRLPTEAEWERAAQGTAAAAFPWGDEAATCGRANRKGCGDELLPVGSRPDGGTAAGLLDLGGNAAEWTADWYAAEYYAASPAERPLGPSAGEARVIRGGSFVDGEDDLRVAARRPQLPSRNASWLGFRCAR